MDQSGTNCGLPTVKYLPGKIKRLWITREMVEKALLFKLQILIISEKFIHICS